MEKTTEPMLRALRALQPASFCQISPRIFSLACRKEHIVPEPRYSKGKSPRLCKEPKVVEKLLNVFDEEDVSE